MWLVALACTFCGLSATAGAKVVYDSALHKSFGIVPTIGQANGQLGTPNCYGSDCSPLTYHSTTAPVQHAENDYLIFWAGSNYTVPDPTEWSAYQTGINTWLTDVANADGTQGNPFSVDTQYYDNSGAGGSKSYVPYNVTNEGHFLDTDPYPTTGNCTVAAAPCLTDAQLQAELTSYITAHSLPTTLNTEYFILTPQGVNSCFASNSSSSGCAYSGYCGYHGDMTVSGNSITYANMPWSYNESGCDVNLAFGVGYPNSDYVDATVGIFSHELSETMTDPELDAWYDSSGNEIGDKCAYIYGGGGGLGNATGLPNNGSGDWNEQFGSHDYLLQMEFSNQVSNCVPRMTETWSGATPNGTGASSWSQASNWAANVEAGAGYSSGGVVQTLSFPALTSSACTGTPTDTCTTANNDNTSLSAYGLSIDDGSGYAITGNSLDVDAGGISATTAASTSKPSAIGNALSLSANQTWAIDGGASNVGQLQLNGGVSGSSDTVGINVQRAGALVLGGSDNEIGAVTATGANSADTGATASQNGTVTVSNKLNASDSHSVAVTDAQLKAPGTATTGSLSLTGGDLEVGQATAPAGSLTVSGSLTLDSASQLNLFIDQSGTTAGTDYSQVSATGNISLAGALALGTPTTCPALNTGDVDTLITTTGSLSGTFSGVPNNDVITLSCTGSAEQVRINYTSNSVTATVVVGAPAAQITGSGAFGNQNAGTVSSPHAFTVTDSGGGTLTIATPGVALVGADQGQYVISSDGCSGQALTPGNSCTVQVEFAPTSAGAHDSASLQITDNAPNSPQTAALSGTGITPPGGGGNGGSTPAPRVTSVSQSHGRWKEAAKPKKPKAPIGTVFSFRLNEQASLTIVFTRSLPGRKGKGGTCVAPSKHNKHKSKCKRLVLGGTLSLTGHSGANTVSFAGHVSGKKLAPGKYSAIIIASSAGGKAQSARLSFTIVK
jgi:hypothetical protein